MPGTQASDDMRDRADLQSTFWSRARKSDCCWIWTLTSGQTQLGNSYGTFPVDGVTRRAHRVAWTLAKGAIPAGMFVLHRCDEPRCVNPDHLFLGDQGANRTDMFLKGRGGRSQTPEALEMAQHRADRWYPDLNLGLRPEQL
jgi:hypothetical protein